MDMNVSQTPDCRLRIADGSDNELPCAGQGIDGRTKVNRLRVRAIAIFISVFICLVAEAEQQAGGEPMPAFSMGLCTFEKGQVPGKGPKRDYWRLGKGWQWAKSGDRRDKSCLAVVQSAPAVTKAWARTPAFGRIDQFIYPEYVISAWVKTERVTGNGISIGFIADNPHKGEHFSSVPITGTRDWTRISFITRLPHQVWKGKLVVRFEGAGKAWVDDVDFWYLIPGYESGPVKGGKEVLDLKDGWKFRPDPQAAGLKDGWENPRLDESKWKPIRIDKGWDPQGYAKYDGLGWYRIRFKMPGNAKGKRLFIQFGAVDEDAYVWLNGDYLGRHFGWDVPFHLELTGKARLGAENTLVVLAYDTIYQGGIWKPVKIIGRAPGEEQQP